MITALKSDTAKKVASNTIYQLLGKVITMSVTILVTVIVTRRFGREGYGWFNIMQTFPALFYIVVDFGLNAIATRELSVDWSKAQKIFGNVLFLRLALAVVLILASGFSLAFFPYESLLKFGTRLSLLLILTQGLFATTNIIFQTKLRYDLSAIGLVCGSVVILIFSLIFTYIKPSILLVSFGYVAGGLVTFLICAFFIKKLGVIPKLSFDSNIIRFLLLQSLPLGLMFIFSQINFKADSILLSVLPLPLKFGLSNTETVGVYGLPYKIFEVSLVIPTFFMNSIFPIFVRHMVEGKEKFWQTFKKSTLVLFSTGLAVGIFGYFLAPLAVEILGGEEFNQSVAILRILLGGVFIFYLTQPISWLIVTLGKQSYLPGIYLISSIVNVLANILLIPRFSFYASSVLTWACEIIILVMLAYFARKAWKLRYV